MLIDVYVDLCQVNKTDISWRWIVVPKKLDYDANYIAMSAVYQENRLRL